MMNRILFFILYGMLSATSLFGQTNSELAKMGDAAMANGQYSNAVHFYAFILYKIQQGEEAIYYPYEISTAYKAPEKNADGTVSPPENPRAKEIELIHKLADAYRLADDYKNAEMWYAAALKHPLEQYPYAQYFYAISLMYNSKFSEASAAFEQFQQQNNNPDNQFYQLANSKIASCEFALNPNSTKEGITITKLSDVLNAGSTSFGLQFVSDDYMIFSSARSNHADSVLTEESNPLELYMLDIYLVKINPDGTFGTVEKFPFAINTVEYHEASAIISADGNSLFFTKMDPGNRNETKIYASRKFNNTWLAPFPMDKNVNMDGFRSMNPELNEDATILYFSTNRPGGEGGMDLWMTTLGPNGETADPVNLGNQINTFDDELTPFYHDVTQTLYFASGGHIGFGGLDIFSARWNEDTEWWAEANNVGAPINSSRDDSYYIVDEQLKTGYVTSDRESCMECDSIYNLSIHCNKIYQVNRPEMKFFISGYVYDEVTNKVIPGAKIEFKDVSYKWDHFELTADENGFYQHELTPNLELFMRATQADYFADKALVFTLGATESKNYTQDFYLERIPQGEITIEGIEYDFDSAKLRPESEKILDSVVIFLELNSDLYVEIRSHTDMRGNDEYNLKLSQRRAQSVVDYLVDQGIPRERLTPKGCGETMPAKISAPDGSIVTLTPEYIETLPGTEAKDTAHQRNRRTAFFVLEQH